jgi:hypothetical protein
MDIKCVCPPKPSGETRHDHDTVTLKDRMDFRSSIAIRNALALEAGEGGEIDMADILAILTERFIRYGIQSWSLVDERNQPVPVSQDAITRLILSDIDLATDIGDEADEKYREAVMLPLLVRGSRSLPSSPTTTSTSAEKTESSGPTGSKSSSPTKPRRRSKQSSTTASPMAGTETTSLSLVGDSSLSPSSESAA